MNRCLYSGSIDEFINSDDNLIFGKLCEIITEKLLPQQEKLGKKKFPY